MKREIIFYGREFCGCYWEKLKLHGQVDFVIFSVFVILDRFCDSG